MTDRAVPFTLSIKVSQISRLERVLKVAAMQGRLHSGADRVNKLASELLFQAISTLEQEYIAQGLLPAHAGAPPAPPAPLTLAPAAYAPPVAPVGLQNPASDPSYRAQLRAAHDARSAHLAGAVLPSVTLTDLEASYRAALAPAGGAGNGLLEAPEGVDWDRAP